MIEADKMQRAVQHQNADFVGDRMAMLFRLHARMVEGDGKIADGAAGVAGRKRQHIGGGIITPKFPVQPLQFDIAGNQATKCTPFGNRAAKLLCKIGQLSP
jgi:hypothetical protein